VVTAQTSRVRAHKSRNRTFARAMRREPVECEKKFWWLVRDRRLGGHKFKRQVLIGSYIADFVCLERKLIVELDGGQHADRAAYDRRRDAFLAAKGFRVIRIWDWEFLESIDGALDMVLRELEKPPSP
jgi:very-short-patch-repair endonuclease